MTTVEGAITSLLKNSANVAAIVGTRVHPMNDPQSIPRPKVTYWRIDTDRSAATGGYTNDGPTGKATPRIQVDCWADDLLTAKALAVAVRQALNGYAGTVGAINGASGITINCIQIVDERDGTAAMQPGQEKQIQRVSLDFKVSFSE